MKRKQALQSASTPLQQPNRHAHRVHRVRQVECATYTIRQVCDRISMARRTFFTLRSQGALPFLEEVQPRLGRLVRYRADLVDAYAANQFNRASA